MKPVIWLVGGALSFWLPIIFAFAIGRSNTGMLVPNVLAVLSASLCYVVFRWLCRGEHLAAWMLFGIYLLGPILLSTATSFVHGGFSQIRGWEDIKWLLLACIFPPILLLLAGTSGVGPSLLVVTVILGSATTVEFTSATK